MAENNDASPLRMDTEEEASWTKSLDDALTQSTGVLVIAGGDPVQGQEQDNRPAPYSSIPVVVPHQVPQQGQAPYGPAGSINPASSTMAESQKDTPEKIRMREQINRLSSLMEASQNKKIEMGHHMIQIQAEAYDMK